MSENPDKEFYLGEKEPELQTEEKINPGLSYGGALPVQLQKYRPRKRSNEDLKRADTLMEMYARKTMLMRRQLYLERRRQEILGYMQNAERRHASDFLLQDVKKLFWAGTILVLAFFFFLISEEPMQKVAVCVSALWIIILEMKLIGYKERRTLELRMHIWREDLVGMQEEHEEILKEKQELLEQIRALEEEDEKAGEPEEET